MINAKKRIKENKAITLVALVVTIVVLIILAGITLSLVLGQSGIVNKAKEARDKTQADKLNTELAMNTLYDQMEGTISGTGSIYSNIDLTKTNPLATQPAGSTLIETDGNKGITIKDANGNEWVWIEVPKTATVYPTAGLAITSFTDAEYTSIENDLHTYTNTYRNGTIFVDEWYDSKGAKKDTSTNLSDTAGCGVNSADYTNIKNAMLKSVYQNGGFWVGRYEVGDATSTTSNTTRTSSTGYTDTAVIKADQHPYDYISCDHAENLASKFAPSGKNSSLLFGVQWDLVLRYLESKGVTQAELKTDSTSWGNYVNANFDIVKGMYNVVDTSNVTLTTWISAGSKYTKASNSCILLTTGATDRNSKMNIYDLAGNVWEWTMEYTSNVSIPCTIRGARYGNDGGTPASFRNNFFTATTNDYMGFRVALY